MWVVGVVLSTWSRHTSSSDTGQGLFVARCCCNMFSAMAYARRLHIVRKWAAIEQRRWLHSVQVSVQLASVSISMSNNCSLLDEHGQGLMSPVTAWSWFSRANWVKQYTVDGERYGLIWDDLVIYLPPHEQRFKDGVLELLLSQKKYIYLSGASRVDA